MKVPEKHGDTVARIWKTTCWDTAGILVSRVMVAMVDFDNSGKMIGVRAGVGSSVVDALSGPFTSFKAVDEGMGRG